MGRVSLRSGDTCAWGTSFTVSPPGEVASQPRIADVRSRLTSIIWVAGTGSATTIRSTTIAAGSIDHAPPVTLSEPGASEPALTLDDGGGGALAAWRRTDGSRQVVEAAVRAGDTGAWSAAEQVSADGATAGHPAVGAGAVLQNGEPG